MVVMPNHLKGCRQPAECAKTDTDKVTAQMSDFSVVNRMHTDYGTVTQLRSDKNNGQIEDRGLIL